MSECALEALAARHVPGLGPVSIDPLGSGLVNRSYRVRRDGCGFSLRLGAPRAADLGLDRGWECRVLQSAASVGLAPRVECCEPGSGLLISQWVEGDCWPAEQSGADEVLRAVALLARRVHALPLPEEPRRVTAAQWIEFYRHRLEGLPASGSRSDLDRQAQAQLAALGETRPEAQVLCHGDLHVQNIVIAATGSARILDWEYAHVAERFWDLAGWASNGDLGDERRRRLLGWYLRREPEPAEAALLGRLAWLYDYVCLLWSEVYLAAPTPAGEAAGAAGGVGRRAERLAQRLCEAGGCSGQVPAH